MDLQPQLVLSPCKDPSEDNLSEAASPRGHQGLSTFPFKSRGSCRSDTSVSSLSQYEQHESSDCEPSKHSRPGKPTTVASGSGTNSDSDDDPPTHATPNTHEKHSQEVFQTNTQSKTCPQDRASPAVETTDNVDNLDILAPNGVSISELISINEKIEQAQQEEDQKLLDKVIDIIGDTDDFDLDETALMFDICSLDKKVIFQIQDVLRL